MALTLYISHLDKTFPYIHKLQAKKADFTASLFPIQKHYEIIYYFANKIFFTKSLKMKAKYIILCGMLASVTFAFTESFALYAYIIA